MATVSIKHAKLTGAPADPRAIIDGPAWDSEHTVIGLENVQNVDTTNATNITSGTLPAARLPTPTSTTLGGVKSLAAASHQFLTQIGTDGTPAQAQPAFTDVSGTALIAQGGTGQTTASAAFDALAPTTTRGDIIFRNASSNTRLAAGTAGYVLQSNGAGSDPSYAAFQSALATSPAARTFSSKLKDVADLRDWSGLDLTDSNDNASLLQDALTQTANSGYVLYVPSGKIALGSTVAWPEGAQIVGSGQAGSSYSSKYTFFHLAHLGAGFEANGSAGTGARSMRGVNFYRSQAAPGPGWAPINADFDIRVKGVQDVTIEDCMFLNPSRLLQQIGDTSGAGTSNNRIFLRNIKGQPLVDGIDLTHCYDVAYLDAIHLWPFWSLDTNVVNYTRANAYAFVFKRVDNPKIGRLFSWGYYRGLAFFNQASVGLDATLPPGSTNMFHADVIGSDNCSIGMLVDSGTNAATIYIDQFYGGADPSRPSASVEPIINVLGNNSDISIGRFYGYQSTNLVSMSGSGGTLTIGESRSTAITTTEFNIGTGNTLRLDSTPSATAATVYAGSGIIETPVWRSFTPSVSSGSGTITTVGAVSGAYRRVGKTVNYYISVTITTNGTGATDLRISNLPFTSASRAQPGSGRNNTSGAMVQGYIVSGSTLLVINKYDNSYPVASGDNVFFQGVYEVA